MSARSVSIAAGLAESTVGQIERGDIASPRLDTMLAIAKVLKVDAGKLMTGRLSK